MHRGIAHSLMRVFEQSSHTAHLEETETYLQVVREFLAHVPAEHGTGADRIQRPLVPRSRFRRRLTAGFSVCHGINRRKP
jgi:hypothetical protein